MQVVVTPAPHSEELGAAEIARRAALSAELGKPDLARGYAAIARGIEGQQERLDRLITDGPRQGNHVDTFNYGATAAREIRADVLKNNPHLVLDKGFNA